MTDDIKRNDHYDRESECQHGQIIGHCRWCDCVAKDADLAALRERLAAAERERDNGDVVLGKIIRETASELGCAPDNEAILSAIDAMKALVRELAAVAKAAKSYHYLVGCYAESVAKLNRREQFNKASEFAEEEARNWRLNGEAGVAGNVLSAALAGLSDAARKEIEG